MPVVFEQPDPVGFLSGPAQAGGYAAQYSADRQFALQAAALRNQSQGQAQQQRMQYQLAQAQAGEQGAALAARGQVTPAQQFQARQQNQALSQQQAGQQAMQQDRMQGQLAMQQQQAAQAPATFSQAESMQLQKFQQAQGDADAKLASGEWDQGTYDRATAQISPRLSALQKKQQQFQGVQRQRAASNGIADNAVAMATRMAAGQQLGKALGWDEGSLGGLVDKDHPELGYLQYDPGTQKLMHIKAAPSAAAKGAGTSRGKAAPDVDPMSDPVEFNKASDGLIKALAKADGTPPSDDEVYSRLQQRSTAFKKFQEGAKYDSDGNPTSHGILQTKQELDGLKKEFPEGFANAPQAVKDQALKLQNFLDGKKPTAAGAETPTTPSKLPPEKKEGDGKPAVNPAQPPVPGTDQPAPKGYKPAGEGAPGYVVPEHWNKGEHYTIEQGKPVRRSRPDLNEQYDRFKAGLASTPEAVQRTGESINDFLYRATHDVR
jgi:hypothetical protein